MTIEAATKVLTIFVLVFAFMSLLYTIGRMTFGVFVFVVSSYIIVFLLLKVTINSYGYNRDYINPADGRPTVGRFIGR